MTQMISMASGPESSLEKTCRTGGAGADSAPAWDELWRKISAEMEGMPPPDRVVLALADRLWNQDVRHVLDLGCGPGRHTLFLASRGYQVYASDVSAEALSACRRALGAAQLSAELAQELMTELSLPDKLVEWVLAVNVLYHGTRSDMRQALAEVWRVLKVGGWFSGTFLSTHDDKLKWYRQQMTLGRAEEVEPGTYHALFRGPSDEHVPHTFISREELVDLLSVQGFVDIEIHEDQRQVSHRLGMENACYWRVLCRKAQTH